MMHPNHKIPGKYIEALERQLLQELEDTEIRRLRREATVDRPGWLRLTAMLGGAMLISLLIALVTPV